MTASAQKRIFVAINVVGGVAVLASYVHGLVSHPDTRMLVWGNVPEWMRPLYTASMLVAAVGYFPFTSYLWLAVDPERVRFLGRYGFGRVLLAYGVILLGSALWLPLTFRMIEEPHRFVWLAICSVLAAVGLAALALLAFLTSMDPAGRGWWYRLSVAGAVAFCVQTLILDATIWPAYYPY